MQLLNVPGANIRLISGKRLLQLEVADGIIGYRVSLATTKEMEFY